MKNVLLVDDDAGFLESLKDGLEYYADGISYLVASNGEDALETLRENEITLLVTDLKMPGLDGFALLSRVFKESPDISCIVITAHGSSEIEQTLDIYSIECVEKPIDIDYLHRMIVKLMEKWGHQGQIKGVNLTSFTQMVEMERKTCRVEIFRSFGGEQGVFYFKGGRLLDAVLGDLPAEEAALQMLSWKDVYIRIGRLQGDFKERMKSPLMSLIIEAARLDDERKRDVLQLKSGHYLDALDDSLSEAENPSGLDEMEGAPVSKGADIPRIVLGKGAMRGLGELMERFNELSGFEGVAVYSPGGELKGFYIPVPFINRIFEK